jgi:AraC-like DNA-binding protein
MALRNVVKVCRARGLDVDALLRPYGLSVRDLDDYDRRIPEQVRARVWLDAQERLADPQFGLHVAERASDDGVGSLDVLDYAIAYSANLGEILAHVCRFHRVLSDAWGIRLVSDGALTRVHRTVGMPPPENESMFAFIVLRARALCDQGFAPHEVRFAHAAPADVSEYGVVFRCPVFFGRATPELILRTADLALPVASSNPGLENVLVRYMTELLAKLPPGDTYVERVRGTVAGLLRHGPPNLKATARAMRASPRTVQRRLEEHGTGHSEVVDALRRQMADDLLERRRMSITEVAFVLGFSDVSSFRRAYKRWTGVAPSRRDGTSKKKIESAAARSP